MSVISLGDLETMAYRLKLEVDGHKNNNPHENRAGCWYYLETLLTY